jgi:hypothetical protein
MAWRRQLQSTKVDLLTIKDKRHGVALYEGKRRGSGEIMAEMDRSKLIQYNRFMGMTKCCPDRDISH